MAETPEGTIPPKSKAKINITVRSKGKHGNHFGKVVVETDHPEYRWLQMTYNGSFVCVDGSLTCSPELIHWGDVVRGQTARRTLLIKRKNADVVQFVEAISDIPGVSVSRRDNRSNPTELEVMLNSHNMPMGQFNGMLKIITKHEVSREMCIPMTGEVIGSVTPYPNAVYVRVSKQGNCKRQIHFRSRVDSPFKIERVEVMPSTLPFNYSYARENDCEWVRTIEFSDVRHDVMEQGEVVVTIDESDTVVTIPVVILRG